ncbi:MAG: hypothetical protein A2904_01870 [Candidatus Staskawiczbacteria bacterium RIFCSPLOWO2_01_FULL_33_9]|uniref:DNA polymerase III subunit delta n=1 Tax=Candidatus Staskawiczbacteria bacterium RIFCSPLOWO2_01_FULL_33_9 TaxID=1802211 RepID=A0A1G2I7U7_9BACT|nr:MAG: hypothetical protein A2904_01870 [Candidatus Staskawiczbacteria bacterium RIFCSPLOWO2_01_FULL_33_9]
MIAGHKKQWNFLKNKFESGQLAHAYLFSGEEKLGKRTLSKEFVKLINCQSSLQKPCGICKNCKDIEKENHLDILMVNKKDDKQEIEISQIREALSFLSYKSYYGGYKTVVIENAEKMNQEAQGCLLKTLEEPKGKTIIILIASHHELLLPTIFSRCQTISFFQTEKYESSKEEQQILKELVKVINSDFAEKFQYAKKVNLEGNNIKGVLEILQKYLRHLLFLKIGVENLTKQDYFPEVTGIFKNYSISKIKEVLKLLDVINTQTSLTNASPKLALEILLMEM